ncbi:MAG: hypothetical protein JNL57_09610 [Bacteroidetes bacterium]|nr:hypothetical protein [Bacteroidota bacterium]
MQDSGLNVDNPMALAGLYGDGVFLPPDMRLWPFAIDGGYAKGILNIVSMSGNSQCPPPLRNTLVQIMGGLKKPENKLTIADFGILNLQAQKVNCTPESVIAGMEPRHVILWLDSWEGESPEIRFYETGMLDGLQILRCHSLPTMLADGERKKVCWNAIRAYFKDI